jgi:hypothetical protein
MYQKIHKDFDWLRFDTTTMTFECGKCETKKQISQEAQISGDGREEANEFANEHKNCKVRCDNPECPQAGGCDGECARRF